MMMTMTMGTMTTTMTESRPERASSSEPSRQREESPSATSTGRPDRVPRRWGGRGSRVPARWRIAAWIVLTTGITLATVLLIMRSLLISDVQTAANAAIQQEAEEFTTFADVGVDPATGQPFTSLDGMLETYLERQHPDQGEVLIGVGESVWHSDNARLRTVDGEPYLLGEDAGTLRRIIDAPGSGGVLDTEHGQLRWGKLDVSTDTGAGMFVVGEFVRPHMEANDRILRMTALVAIGGLLLTAGISYLVAGRILAPVRAIGRAASEISETDLSVRVPVRTRDDLGELAQSFNSMLDRIENAYTTQRRFIDDASHELRTPITVIRGHLELLGEDPGERAATLAVVDRELGRMSRLVTDLLMLAKAERPDFLHKEDTDLAELMLHVESTIQALDDRPWLLMEVAEGRARVDPQRLTQALLQYAANAVQYSPEGAPVRFGSTLVEDGDRHLLRLWLADNGPGISEEDMPRVFERFNRAVSPTEHQHGVGLGLSIVRAIADAHDGQAWVESAFGQGATFGIDLPVDLLPTPEEAGTTEMETDGGANPYRAALRGLWEGRR